MIKETEITIMWFRRDLRLNDNTALFHALSQNSNVLPLFIFDSTILNKIQNKSDARISFIYQTLTKLKADLEKTGSSMLILHGEPLPIIQTLTKKYKIKKIYANRAYETYDIERDKQISDYLQTVGIELNTYKDHLIFEPGEILKPDGTPYLVYTPFLRKWLEKFQTSPTKTLDYTNIFSNFIKSKKFPLLALEGIGFKKLKTNFPPAEIPINTIQKYHETRDIPALDSTSKLGIHLRMGTLSIRKITEIASENNKTWLKELVWREFFAHIFYFFPKTENQAFRKQFTEIQWSNNEEFYHKWCKGETGYPMVDAGMRQLNETGFMHNRVRMIAGSFLVKHLHINWKWGEMYFAEKLLDYEKASNIGNWQWLAGSGCDATPWFRIFNPETQQKKFDKQLNYIKKWINEFGTPEYAKPIVQHNEARNKALLVIKH